jgi:hypothetical protein
MSDISQKTSGFVRDLGEAARQNPLSAALIGMGVLWLFTSGRTVERAGEFARSGFERIRMEPMMLLRPRVRPSGQAPMPWRARQVGKGRAARW